MKVHCPMHREVSKAATRAERGDMRRRCGTWRIHVPRSITLVVAMRTLYLTRHAKSSWDDPGTDDFHRPLNDRGERDAPFMAMAFKERGEPVDRLVSSSAVRAITTAREFASALGVKEGDITQDKGIYLAPTEMLLRTVNLLNDDWQRVMMFGHNPGFTELAEYISDADIGEMATCATVRIDFTVNNWAEVSMGLGTLVWHDFPKRHAGLK